MVHNAEPAFLIDEADFIGVVFVDIIEWAELLLRAFLDEFEDFLLDSLFAFHFGEHGSELPSAVVHPDFLVDVLEERGVGFLGLCECSPFVDFDWLRFGEAQAFGYLIEGLDF